MKLFLHALCIIIIAAAIVTLPCFSYVPAAMAGCAKVMSGMGIAKVLAVTTFMWWLFMKIGKLAGE